MILAEQVVPLDQYEKYLTSGANFATSATCPDLVEIEVTEEDAPALDIEKLKYKRILEARLSGVRVSPKSDVESATRLMYHLPDPPFYFSQSPFDVLDKILPDEEKTIRLINFIAHKLNIQFAPQLVARLHFLFEAVEEDPDEGPISPESLSNFIAFLQNTPNLKYPDVVLTPSNEIRAQWRTGPNRHFAVVFLPSGTTRYVIFKPNPRDPDKIDRLSGVTSVDALMETAEPHGVLDWAIR